MNKKHLFLFCFLLIHFSSFALISKKDSVKNNFLEIRIPQAFFREVRLIYQHKSFIASVGYIHPNDIMVRNLGIPLDGFIPDFIFKDLLLVEDINIIEEIRMLIMIDIIFHI